MTEQILFVVSHYNVLRSLGSGGMGEVFLAYDTHLDRYVALKQIRKDLTINQKRLDYFLNEAYSTGRLAHPAIVPIYTIMKENDHIFFIMPFIEGITLKQLFITALDNEEQGLKSEHIHSVSYLSHLFLTICRAVAYAHSKKVMHRDLKPSNILVGEFGEVRIVDWGLAQLMEPNKNREKNEEKRIEGSVKYIAPETAYGEGSDSQTEVYSLGIILYEMLTLRYPFNRGTLSQYQESLQKEVLVEPTKVAPFRNIPPLLSHIALKCLAPAPEKRYPSVEALVYDLEVFFEGRSDWLEVTKLNPKEAKTSKSKVQSLIPDKQLTEIIKIELSVNFGPRGSRIGFLFGQDKGYSVWLSVKDNSSLVLLPDTTYRVCLEKIENSLYVYLNDILEFSEITTILLYGPHIELVFEDAQDIVSDITIYEGVNSSHGNLLAIPHALLSNKEYDKALQEYRSIATSEADTVEGRKALFYAGLTVLEKAKHTPQPKKQLEICNAALSEFTKLRGTAGAPLEFLGKTLVFQFLKDYEKVIECFEEAFIRYTHHPLLMALQEHLLKQMADKAHHTRKVSYELALLAARFVPKEIYSRQAYSIFRDIMKTAEIPYFFDKTEEITCAWPDSLIQISEALQLSFLLAKPSTIVEMIENILKTPIEPLTLVESGLFALIELEEWKTVQVQLDRLFQLILDVQTIARLQLIQKIVNIHEQGAIESDTLLSGFPGSIEFHHMRYIRYIVDFAISQRNITCIQQCVDQLLRYELTLPQKLLIQCYSIWVMMLGKKWDQAGEAFQQIPPEQMVEQSNDLFFLYASWLYIKNGKKSISDLIKHIPQKSYQPSHLLFFYLENSKQQKEWLSQAFVWEKRKFHFYSKFFAFFTGKK